MPLEPASGAADAASWRIDRAAGCRAHAACGPTDAGATENILRDVLGGLPCERSARRGRGRSRRSGRGRRGRLVAPARRSADPSATRLTVHEARPSTDLGSRPSAPAVAAVRAETTVTVAERGSRHANRAWSRVIVGLLRSRRRSRPTRDRADPTSEDPLARAWATIEPGRLVARGHPAGDFLEAWAWDVLERTTGTCGSRRTCPTTCAIRRGALRRLHADLRRSRRAVHRALTHRTSRARTVIVGWPRSTCVDTSSRSSARPSSSTAGARSSADARTSS